jgi:glycosyltransferase involved in cell wall biosynthesis
VAIVAIRNEAAYIANCLRDMVRNGVDVAVIDNESTDGSRSIYLGAEFSDSLKAIRHLPFKGAFHLEQVLNAKQALIDELETDWVIHVDADEIMHSYREGETLRAAIERMDSAGYNAIDFNEFVFLPVDFPYVPNVQSCQPLLHYYFLDPQWKKSPNRKMRAWRKDSRLTIAGGGHRLEGGALSLAPEQLAIRHYIFRSQGHAFAKYATRIFPADELQKRWHLDRHEQPVESFVFPPAGELCRLGHCADRNLDRSKPRKRNYWLWRDSKE